MNRIATERDEVAAGRTAPAGKRPLADHAVTAFLFGSFVYALAHTVADPDLWGHVRFGQDLIRTGDLFRADTYSYLSGGQPWINHEWLAEAIFYLAYAAAGGTGLVALKVLLGLTMLGLVHSRLRRAGLPPIRAAMVVLIGYLPFSVGFLTVRPQVFTTLGFLLVILAMDAADRGRWRWLWALPLVFALWANLHGGFLAGIGVLAVWVAVHLIVRRTGRGSERPRPPAGALLGSLGLCLLATLLNPYGVGLWEFLLETAIIPRPEITEWSPVSLLTIDGAGYVLLFALTAVALTRESPPPGWPLVAVYACVAPLPVLAHRHLPLFVLAALVIAATPLGALSHRLTRARGEAKRPAPRWFAALLIAFAVLMVGLSIPRFRGVVIDGQRQPFPARAVGLLAASGVRGDLAVHFDWAEYAIWHLAPDLKVSWDGRRETVYGPEVHATNLRFFFGVGDWDRLLTDHGTDLALVSPQTPVYNLLKLSPPWTVVYEDSLSALFAPEGSPQARQIRAATPPNVPINGDELLFP